MKCARWLLQWGERAARRARKHSQAVLLGLCGPGTLLCGQALPLPGTPTFSPSQVVSAPTGDLRHGRELLQDKRFLGARDLFREYLKGHPANAQAELGLGDAELGLHQYEAAEATYRALVGQQPQLWQAHKNLVVVEAALGRWDDFEGERKILSLARQRGEPGISATESDVIDSFEIRGERWVVRAYFEPVGRSMTIYNFEQFRPDGRVGTYVSLEDAAAAEAALHPGDVRIGDLAGSEAGKPAAVAGRALALNWYNGAAHGTVRRYSSEPKYKELRAEVLRWARSEPMAAPGKRQKQ